jgi:deoxycytidine triphosphate deaminase
MTLLAGDSLDPRGLFKPGPMPIQQGSSVDLTIGDIIDHKGKKVEGPFILEPGCMVQVCSAEVFMLPPTVTGHVTYKTTQTQRGIWALTVGIVDPGWDGPISTTLLNFSRQSYAITQGDAFLRASFFEHDSIPEKLLRKSPPLSEYKLNTQKSAATVFPNTFLDSDKISKSAGEAVLKKIREEAFSWIAGIALLFALLQITTSFIQPIYFRSNSELELSNLQKEIGYLKEQISALKKHPVLP